MLLRSDSVTLTQTHSALKLLSEEATRVGLDDDRPALLHTFTLSFSSPVDVDSVIVQDKANVRHKLQVFY
jgi:hypothetical protein